MTERFDKIKPIAGMIDAYELDRVVRAEIDPRYRFTVFPHYSKGYANDSLHQARASRDYDEESEEYQEFKLWHEHKDNSYYPPNGLSPDVILSLLCFKHIIQPGNYVISLSW